jgi:hypothetical protein
MPRLEINAEESFEVETRKLTETEVLPYTNQETTPSVTRILFMGEGHQNLHEKHVFQ